MHGANAKPLHPKAHAGDEQGRCRPRYLSTAATGGIVASVLRLYLGAGDWIDVLAPDAVNLDDPSAPVAYCLHLRRQTVLVVNRQAVDGHPTMLQANGSYLDSLVLPDRSDPINAGTLVRTLKPRLVALPQDGSVSAADLAPLPKGTRTWLAGEGAELALSSQAGACGA